MERKKEERGGRVGPNEDVGEREGEAVDDENVDVVKEGRDLYSNNYNNDLEK
jgi:hypothetical protein